MARIPLRTYLKEIENLIERGEIEQAIAHTRNILSSYPKHIHAYRLLGKAYLESQRYSEASDILQRVLSVIPDDFVSQIGMSIIREDEGNLDAAIWHMERAYEVQPFNPAVQDELRRLYGRRDGVEPPKIRLTRGALVRMYIRGELYPQAIAEIRAALAEDPQRLDLLVLLARLYHLTNQKVEATEVCSSLISKLPYCYEANQILAEILPGTSRAEDAKKFQQRIYALDPYAAFISPTAPTSADVADQAVMVEQFIWEPSMSDSQAPEWTRSLGVQWEETEEEALPDWISSLKPETPAAAVTTEVVEESMPVDEARETPAPVDKEAPGEKDELIPDWMKEAGWAPVGSSADEVAAGEEPGAQVETGGETEDDIAPAEIPDWLQEIAPPEAGEASGDQEATDERTGWLSSLLAEPAGDVSQSESIQAQQDDEAPLPDWLSGLERDFDPLQASSAEGEQPVSPPAETLPDWAFPGEPAAPVPEEGDEQPFPDWLDTLAAESSATAEPAADLPGWLNEVDTDAVSSFEVQPPAAPEEAPAAPVDLSDEDAAMAWLEGLAARQGADEATLITSPDERQETPPEWVREEMETGELDVAAVVETPGEEPAPPDEAESGFDLPEWVEEAAEQAAEENQPAAAEPVTAEFEPAGEQPGTDLPQSPAVESAVSAGPQEEEESIPDFADMDAAMAWLEGLAARQGADESTLITPPEQRLDTPPEWVQSEAEATVGPQVEMAAPEDVVSPEQLPEPLEPAEETTPVEEPAPQMEPPAPVAQVEAEESIFESEEAPIPDWLAEVLQSDTTTESEAPAGLAEASAVPEPGLEAPQAETQPVPSEAMDPDAAFAWLESLAARQGADEGTLITSPDERVETPPDWLQMDEEEPAAQVQETGAPAMDTQAGETPVIETQAVEAAGEAAAVEPSVVEEPAAPESPREVESPAMVEEAEPTMEEAATPVETAASGEPPGSEAVPGSEEVPDWLKTIGEEVEEEKSVAEEAVAWAFDAEEPASQEFPSVEAETVPDWLQQLEGEEQREAGAVPDWLKDVTGEGVETESRIAEGEVTLPAGDIRGAWEPELEMAGPEPAGAPSPDTVPGGLAEAQAALLKGDIDRALLGYSKLIQNGEHLDETIRDLRDALYRYPVDIAIWQSLGDAYARNDQLQEALDAYTKAEELLR